MGGADEHSVSLCNTILGRHNRDGSILANHEFRDDLDRHTRYCLVWRVAMIGKIRFLDTILMEGPLAFDCMSQKPDRQMQAVA